MKKDIHPKLYENTKVTCACGNSFVTISTLAEITVDICSVCHPFFTGQQKFIDTEGRIEKFQKKVQQAKDTKTTGKAKKTARKEKQESSTSLKEMLSKASKAE